MKTSSTGFKVEDTIRQFQPENLFLLYCLTGNDSFLKEVRQNIRQNIDQSFQQVGAQTDPQTDPQIEAQTEAKTKAQTEAQIYEQLDQQKLFQYLQRHRLIPAAYRLLAKQSSTNHDLSDQLNSFNESNTAAGLQKNLKDEYLNITKKSLKNLNALIQTANLLRKEDIPFLCMKGLPLAMDVYANYTDRDSIDIDLLIDQNNLNKTHNVLIGNGFKLTENLKNFTPKQFKYFTSVKHSFDYHNPSLRIGLELHWQAFNAKALFPFAFDELYLHKKQIRIGDQVFDTFDPVHNFLYLCLHGSVHGYYRLFWLQDVYLYFSKYQDKMDWGGFSEIVRKNRLERPVGQSLLLINQIYGIPLPEQPVKILLPQPFSATSRENRIEKERKHPSLKKNYILNEQSSNNQLIRIPRKDNKIRYYLNTALTGIDEPEEKLKTRKLGRLRRFYYLLCLKPDLTYKKQILTSLFVFPKDWQKIQLPDRLFFVYYLLRPFTWFWEAYIRRQQ